MSILDKLLETDVEKLRGRESRKYEVKRLSEAMGEAFIVNCRPLTSEQMQHVGEISKTNADIKENVVLEGCDIDGKRFTNKELLKKFGVESGKEVIQNLFKVGEISALYDVINEISGYGKDVVEEVKN